MRGDASQSAPPACPPQPTPLSLPHHYAPRRAANTTEVNRRPGRTLRANPLETECRGSSARLPGRRKRASRKAMSTGRWPESRKGGLTGSNRWQLDSKTATVASLFPGRGNLANKWVNCKLQSRIHTQCRVCGWSLMIVFKRKEQTLISCVIFD